MTYLTTFTEKDNTEDIVKTLKAEGGVIIERLVPEEVMDAATDRPTPTYQRDPTPSSPPSPPPSPHAPVDVPLLSERTSVEFCCIGLPPS